MISNRYKEESDHEKDNDADCFSGAEWLSHTMRIMSPFGYHLILILTTT